MGYRLAADLTLVLHLLFIIFILFGGLLCLHRIRWAWLHLPAMVWGVWVEWASWICPLTPLENHLRQAGNAEAYSGGFIDHYIVPIVYPPGLTRQTQVVLGVLILVINFAIYFQFLTRKTKAGERT